MRLSLSEKHIAVKKFIVLEQEMRRVLGFAPAQTQIVRATLRLLADAQPMILDSLRAIPNPPQNPPKGDSTRIDKFEVWLADLLARSICAWRQNGGAPPPDASGEASA